MLQKIETSKGEYMCEVKPQARAALVQRCRSSVVQWLPLPFFLNLSSQFLLSSLPKLLLWKLHSFDSSLTEWPQCKCETFSFTLFPPLPLSSKRSDQVTTLVTRVGKTNGRPFTYFSACFSSVTAARKPRKRFSLIDIQKISSKDVAAKPTFRFKFEHKIP